MRLRVLVVAAFIAMASVPAYLAWSAGFLPGPTQASAGSGEPPAPSSSVVTSLAWPDEPLGLAAAGTQVFWEQRDRSAAVSGLWYYDARSRRTEKLLGRAAMGRSAGFPAATGDLVVWAARQGKRGGAIEAYELRSMRRWQVAVEGRDPSAAGDVAIWVEPDGAGRGRDMIRGLSSLTDEQYAISAGGRVRDLSAAGPWVVWLSGRERTGEVWASSFRQTTLYRLSAAGTAVAADRDRILWAAAVGRHSSAIFSWDRHARRSTALYRLPGVTSSLSSTRRYVVWVTTRKATGPQVWAYDAERSEAYPVDPAGGRQASPVIVGGDVYWADDRNGRWELYSRSLQR